MQAESISRSRPSGPVIVEAGWRDINALYRLEKLCFPRDSWPLLDIILVLLLPGVLRLKVVDKGEMIAFILIENKPAQDLAWIATFAVHPEHRSRGIGTALLDEAERRTDKSRIRLSVRMSNEAAIRLYKRSGFRAIGNWPRYYRGGEDALVMEKEVLQPADRI